MRRPIPSLVLAALVLAVGAGDAMARGVHAMTLALNGSERVALGGEAAKVVVVDPKVADVSMVDAHSVIVLGRGLGSTQLTVTDSHGRTLLASLVTVVSPDTFMDHVVLYRGVEATRYSCGEGRCQPTDPAQTPLAVAPVGSTQPTLSVPSGESAAAANATERP